MWNTNLCELYWMSLDSGQQLIDIAFQLTYANYKLLGREFTLDKMHAQPLTSTQYRIKPREAKGRSKYAHKINIQFLYC